MAEQVLDAADLRRAQLERVLALARLSLGTLAVYVLVIDPAIAVNARSGMAARLLGAFMVYGLTAAVVVAFRGNSTALGTVLHMCDLGWAAAITSYTEAPTSLFSVFFIFVLVSAAYRWGLRETLLTGAAITAVLLGQVVAVPAAFADYMDAQHLAIRCGYALGLAFLIGSLAEEQQLAHAEAMAAEHVVAAVSLSSGLREGLQHVLRELARVYGSTRALLVVEDRDSARFYCWEIRSLTAAVRVQEISADSGTRWFQPLPGPGPVWTIRRHGQEAAVSRRRGRLPADAAVLDEAGVSGLLAAALELGADWRGRLFVVEPTRFTRERGRRWLADLLPTIAPLLYSLYLVRRLRSRASAVERARMARELHDGVIQSLVGLEMEVDALRRRSEQGQPAPSSALGDIQRRMHDEVLNVRDLMHQMRTTEIGPRALPEHLTEMANRFRRDTGIDARVVCALGDVEVPPRVARELARIAQEALVNVRKHSGARHVIIRFGTVNGQWQLAIDDDGSGFGFDGRFTLDELDRARRGPVVIKERTRLLKGTLVIDSVPQRGTRLEVMVPRDNHE